MADNNNRDNNSLTSSDHSADESVVKRPKRYKKFLFKDYNPCEVSAQTKNVTESCPEKVKHNCLPDNLNECNESYVQEVESHERISAPESFNFYKSDDDGAMHLYGSVPLEERVTKTGTQEDDDLSNISYNDSSHDYDYDDHLTSSANYSDSSNDDSTNSDNDENTYFGRIMFPAAELTV